MFFEKGAIYHIYNRSNETVFRNRDNYIFFLGKFKDLIAAYAEILAWCLMPNHFHFLVQANEKTAEYVKEKHRPALQVLSKNMGILISSYTQAFNKQKNRRGCLFSHHTKAKMLNECHPISGNEVILSLNSDYTTTCFQYIHLNPVLAGLVLNPEDWEFSSFRDYAGMRKGKLVNQKLAFELINLDEKDFYFQSTMSLNEGLLDKIF